MYKVADDVYGETEFYNNGKEFRVETHLYYVDGDGNMRPVTEIYDIDSEPIDDYDDLNFIKYTHDSFSFTAKVKLPIAFKVGITATAHLQDEFDRKHRI